MGEEDEFDFDDNHYERKRKADEAWQHWLLDRLRSIQTDSTTPIRTKNTDSRKEG